MLFRMKDNKSLEALPFLDFADLSKLEKDLENLLAENLFGTLFEKMPLMPFYQERPLQAEADIYALDSNGDVVVFELKRSVAGSGALEQLLRYAERADTWSFADLQRKFRAYSNDENASLSVAHRDAFNLDEPLLPSDFNRKQRLVVIGSAANQNLVRSVTYWRDKGLDIDFLPYRIYRIGDTNYFEFFAKPYDGHFNPGTIKGVLFDTNRSYDTVPHGCFKSMVEQKRISAWGDRKDAVRSLSKGDLVFYSHRWVGLVAAARVDGVEVKKDKDELYWDVTFLTPLPTEYASIRAMPFRDVTKVTGKSFFWARIQKVPYLTREEAEHLLGELKKTLRG